MSFFSFTRQEQMTILFLALALLVGGIITLIKRHVPDFAPELHYDAGAVLEAVDSSATGGRQQERAEPDTTPPEPDTTSPGPVDINRATAEQLRALPGIGPTMALRIVAHREARGRYRKLEDLKEVKGIGDKTLERLRPYIKID